MSVFAMGLVWYIALLVLGLIFVPLTRILFGKFFYDRGYPFAKTIGIIVLSYTAFLFGFMQILPFTFLSLFVLSGIWLAINGFIFSYLKKQNHGSFEIVKDRSAFPFLLFEEFLFVVSFIGYLYVRAHAPEIRGLEKFMDYGFMNAILRSEFFPPIDMWYSGDPISPAGYPINYYYFGHLSGSMLIALTGVPAAYGYNFVLATVFAQGMTLAFSLASNLVYVMKRHLLTRDMISKVRLGAYGLLGAFLVNLGGNLHTIYFFTSGYEPDSPVPFWEIMVPLSEVLNPERLSTYWYPNATRFIPNTIHEFPSYSHVVADLHGHVFDIPFVLVTLALLFTLFMYGVTRLRTAPSEPLDRPERSFEGVASWLYQAVYRFSHDFLTHLGIHINAHGFRFRPKYDTFLVLTIAAMIAIHYMTNAMNGPLYLLALIVVLFIVYGPSVRFFTFGLIAGFTFFLVSYPFSVNFSPFASGIGVNCAESFLPAELVAEGKLGIFVFEAGKCQSSALYMMFVLWGFYWIGILLYAASLWAKNSLTHAKYQFKLFTQRITLHQVDLYVMLLFLYGIVLTIVPEFIYAKDIYPDHFRANTMFKLGYQAFIMMSLAMVVVLLRIRMIKSIALKYTLKAIYTFFFFLVALYPFFSIPSYYPQSLSYVPGKNIQLDGEEWILQTSGLSQDKEIIDYFKENVDGQPTILEAQGDSYTDYNRVSAYTGLPTVAGWWVHQWLWRNDPDAVGRRVPDIEEIYQSPSTERTLQLLQKYNVQYVIISGQEREKYQNLNEEKFSQIGTRVLETRNGVGSIYRIDY